MLLPVPMKIGIEAIPGNGILLERRTVPLWPETGVFIIIHLFRYTEKNTVFSVEDVYLIPQERERERESIDEYLFVRPLFHTLRKILLVLDFVHGLLREYASSSARRRKGNDGCVVRTGETRGEKNTDGGPLVLQGGNDARQRSSMSSEAGATKELRRKKRALSACGKNNTCESKPQPDHRLLAISSRRDTWCLRTAVSAPFQPLLLSISPRQGHRSYLKSAENSSF